MKSLLISTTIFAILTVSCSKKDSNNSLSKKELLTSGSWKLTSVTADEDANGSYETDRFASFSDCYKDNDYTFRSSGELELNEGPTKCDPIDPQTVTASWQLTQNETHLIFGSDEYKLEELTTSTLKWKEEYSGGTSAFVTFTKR